MASSYRTIQGDTFDSIAHKLWRDAHLSAELIAANVQYADVVIFGPGVVLSLPDVKQTGERSGVLPPWYTVR